MRRLIVALALSSSLVLPASAVASPMSWALRPTLAPAEVSGTTAPPEEALDEAKRAFEAGSREYKLGNYEQAVALFERSYELSERPALLFNLGQAYARKYEIDADVENLRKAKKLFSNFIVDMEAVGELDPEAKEDADRLIGELTEEIAAHEDRERERRRDGARGGEDRPLARKGWFWAIVAGSAALVVGGVTAAVVLSRDDGFDPELGRVADDGLASDRALGLRF